MQLWGGAGLEPIDILENLVDELMKDQPEEQKLKDGMKAVGIEYSDDPVERINRVLRKMHESNQFLKFVEDKKEK